MSSDFTSIGLFHLANGHLILAKYTDKYREGSATCDYVLYKPAVLDLSMPVEGQLKVQLIPFGGVPGILPPLESWTLTQAHVLIPPRPVPKNLEDRYLEATSGLVLR